MSSIRELLTAAGLPGDSGRLEAELLLSHCLGKSRSYLYAWPEQEVSADCRRGFAALLSARRRGMPLAYLTGRREFWSLDLQVDDSVLIPRPETETLVEWALGLDLPVEAAVADWGTGSGAIALALASERPRWQIVASDRSAAALALAAANSRRLSLDQVRFVRADWGQFQMAGSLDLVVSNPPYIAEDDPHLTQGDLPFEPATALVAGRDGLDAVRRIIDDAVAALKIGGWLLLEHGHQQARCARELMQSAGFEAVDSRRDLAGIERVSGGRLA